MRDCRGYNEAFNLAAELTLHSLKSLSAKLSQSYLAPRRKDVRGVGGGAGGKAKRAAVVTRDANVLQLHERWQHPNAAWL